MANALIITAPSAMTAPLAGTPKLRLSGDRFILSSDGFSGASGTLAGRVSDAVLGGSPAVWQSASDAILTVNGSGSVVPNSTPGGFFNYIYSAGGPQREIEVSLKITTRFSTTLWLDLFRDVASRKMRLELASTGGSIVYSASVDSAVVPNSRFSFADGDTVRFRYNTRTGKAQVWVNEAEVVSVVYVPPVPVTGGRFGIAGLASSTGALDNFVLAETIL